MRICDGLRQRASEGLPSLSSLPRRAHPASQPAEISRCCRPSSLLRVRARDSACDAVRPSCESRRRRSHDMMPCGGRIAHCRVERTAPLQHSGRPGDSRGSTRAFLARLQLLGDRSEDCCRPPLAGLMMPAGRIALADLRGPPHFQHSGRPAAAPGSNRATRLARLQPRRPFGERGEDQDACQLSTVVLSAARQQRQSSSSRAGIIRQRAAAVRQQQRSKERQSTCRARVYHVDRIVEWRYHMCIARSIMQVGGRILISFASATTLISHPERRNLPSSLTPLGGPGDTGSGPSEETATTQLTHRQRPISEVIT